MDFVFENPTPTAHHPLSAIDNSVSILAQLEKVVDILYLDSSSVLQSKTHPSLSSSLMVKHDIHRGKTIEITTTTPVTCSIEDAASQIWGNFTKHRDAVDNTFRYVRRSVNHESVTPVNGLAFVRKYEEPDRIVFVVAEQLLLPTQVLQFGMRCWTVITRSESEPCRSSVVRSVLQLYTECQEGVAIRQRDLQDAEEKVLGALSVKMRKNVEAAQDALVEEAGLTTGA
ncbi:hypothetical protein BBJ28_00005022 [Nothophytophthora sp. Chile5]|nr:hypothetical protein BBJ28_00005022 [Nothophytophthora sp. Chile5]